MKQLPFITISMIVILAGCQSTGVIPMSQDSYFIGKKDGSPGLGVSLSNKLAVYEEASAYCSTKGLELFVLRENVTPSAPFQLGSTELHFKCARPGGTTRPLVKDPDTAKQISDIDTPPSAKVTPNKYAYAIVIGIETYRQQLPKATFASHDAQTVTEYLTKVLGYPQENVITLLNGNASYVDMVKYFEKWLPNNVPNGGKVFVYYSGHGAPNPTTGESYLVPYDGDPSFIDQTGYPLKRMYDSLGKLAAKEVIVALDSCFSGAGGRSVLAKGTRPIIVSVENSLLASKNITVFSASAGSQISSSYDEKGHGLFTYFFLKGIKNEDVVKADGSLEVRDLYEYVKPQVESMARRKYNNEQTPQLIEPKKK